MSILEEVIKALKKLNIKVSIDSANEQELVRGAMAGADYILSINEKNMHIMNNIKSSVPILIPSTQGDLKSLERIIKIFIRNKKDFYADPILDPIHYGFSESLTRYVNLRKKFPLIKMFMGTGNLTELTDSDSSGVNAILMGLVSELSINAVLVVQVSGHCRNSIRETDIARKIMYFSKINKRLPFRINEGLMTTSNRKPTRKSKKEINEIKNLIKDKNFRIFLSDKGINVLNSETKIEGTDPFDFYNSLKVENDASHSFYLGVELARAQIAYQLGKNYDQDNELEWGIAYTQVKNLNVRPKLKINTKKMIIETIISTVNSKGKVNFAPFGIKKNNNFIYISPYIPSRTLENLNLNKCAVINYTDDVRYFVDCLVGEKNFKKLKSFQH